jgi:signal transduction histidine kinase
MEGDLTGYTQGLQPAVHRIVQEALTDTLEYAASDTTVQVAVCADRDRDLVRVTVQDTGPARHPRPRDRSSSGGGHGLVGMTWS